MNINICMKKCKMGLEEMIIKRLFKGKNLFRNQMALPHKTDFFVRSFDSAFIGCIFNIFTIWSLNSRKNQVLKIKFSI